MLILESVCASVWLNVATLIDLLRSRAKWRVMGEHKPIAIFNRVGALHFDLYKDCSFQIASYWKKRQCRSMSTELKSDAGKTGRTCMCHCFGACMLRR